MVAQSLASGIYLSRALIKGREYPAVPVITHCYSQQSRVLVGAFSGHFSWPKGELLLVCSLLVLGAAASLKVCHHLYCWSKGEVDVEPVLKSAAGIS